MDNLTRVMDFNTGRLKRWESYNGKPLAKVVNDRLILTKAGKRLGYKVTHNHLEVDSNRPGDSASRLR